MQHIARKISLDPVRDLLIYLGENPDREGLEDTPARYIKALADMTMGYAVDPESVLKAFKDGAEQYNEMVLVKDIPFYSLCEHHILPFFGTAHIAYIPDKRIVGLSKLSRLVDVFAKRLQVQERMTQQIALALFDGLVPLGVAVVMQARHLCMESRGIQRPGTETVTSAMLGAFMEQPETRAEFMGLIK